MVHATACGHMRLQRLLGHALAALGAVQQAVLLAQVVPPAGLLLPGVGLAAACSSCAFGKHYMSGH